MTDKPTRMTMEEIDQALTEMGRDPDAGADRFRALKMLRVDGGLAQTLPEPMAEGEVIRRLQTLIQAAGTEISKIAFARAFPTKREQSIDDAPLVHTKDLSPEILDKVKKITSLKLLYRAFPEVKRHGVPKGYPSGRGMAIQLEWLRRAAARLYLDRANDEVHGPETFEGMDAISERAKASRIQESERPETEPQEPKPSGDGAVGSGI